MVLPLNYRRICATIFPKSFFFSKENGKKVPMDPSKVALRASRILNFFLLALALIGARVWQLSVFQYDDHYKESLKPQRRTVILSPERGTIRDRFNLPLAVNQIQYNACIRYAAIRKIPRVRYEKDSSGKKRRTLSRLRYIEKLSQFLGSELDLDPQEVEDRIHGQASLFPHTPFVLKEDISEEFYFKLKALEKDWVGMEMEMGSRRVYPNGKLACDVLGYMGAISEREYLRISNEMRMLESYLSERRDGRPTVLPKGFSKVEEVETRLSELKERSYTINDQVGKAGVESSFDELLRGARGKKVFEVDIQGNPLQELPGAVPVIHGERLILSLSSELQQEAEELLSEYEVLLDERDKAGTKPRSPPWLRGGAIVAMLPETGEIVALASYPRFDPNDLVPAMSFAKRSEKRSSIFKWLESESYIGEIWDGIRPIEREVFSSDSGTFSTEERWLDWEGYIQAILHENAPIRQEIEALETLGDVAAALNDEPPETIVHPRDRSLFTDLLSLAFPADEVSPPLLAKLEEMPLTEFRAFCQMVASRLPTLRKEEAKRFRKGEFQRWRDLEFSSFMREKRRIERSKKRYARPYIEYLALEEQRQFNAHFEKVRWKLLHNQLMAKKGALRDFLTPFSKRERIELLKLCKPFSELSRPLKGKYPHLRRNSEGVQLQKHLAAAFYPFSGYGTGRSQAFRAASPMGSIFKLVPSYAGIKKRSEEGAPSLNPFTVVDDMQWTSRPGSNSQVLGYQISGEPIKRYYKGGRLPRAYPKIGKIDVVKALERSSNLYFSLLASEVLDSPSTLIETAQSLGIGSKTGIDLPGEYAGILPDDIAHNKTGLYSFAIGQHSLVATPLQAACMLSSFANGGKLLKPQIAKLSAGIRPGDEGHISFRGPEVRNTLYYPEGVQQLLLSGMHQVVNGERGSARFASIRKPFHTKAVVDAYRRLSPYMIGKTGTAEIFYKSTIDAHSRADLEKHVWFGAIGYEDESLTTPELVIIVYSRFGAAGRQGAPIAARILERWREIKARH